MADYDAIVIGAGHNGLAAAVLLQKAGLHTLCLDSKLYAGGMASTVELFDGYQFEIAGSLQFPTSAKVSGELGLDESSTVDPTSCRFRCGASATTRCLLHRPDEVVDPPQRRARRRGRQRHGGPDGLESGADPCPRPIRGGATAEVIDEMYACAKTNSSARPSPTCSSDRSPMCSTATSRTARSTARCGACCPSRGQHHLPWARHPWQRGRAGIRSGRARRERRC